MKSITCSLFEAFESDGQIWDAFHIQHVQMPDELRWLRPVSLVRLGSRARHNGCKSDGYRLQLTPPCWPDLDLDNGAVVGGRRTATPNSLNNVD